MNEADRPEWFTSLNERQMAAIAARLSLRCIPFAFQFALKDRDVDLLLALRASLVPAAATAFDVHNLTIAVSSYSVVAAGASQQHRTDSPKPLGLSAMFCAGAASSLVSEQSDASEKFLSVCRHAFTCISENEKLVFQDYANLTKCESVVSLLDTPLWNSQRVPADVSELLGLMQKYWREEGDTWAFWSSTYQQLLEGIRPDWELISSVLSIKNETWGLGAEAVAQEIELVRVQLAAKRAKTVPPEQIASQAYRLLKTPEANTTFAHLLIEEIESALSEFMRRFQCNELPPALETLQRIAKTVSQIAEISQSGERITELEDQLKILVAENTALSMQVADLRVQLASVGKSSLLDKGLETAVLTSVKILTTGFWSSVAVGVTHFTGLVDLSAAVERLGLFANSAPDMFDGPDSSWPETLDV